MSEFDILLYMRTYNKIFQDGIYKMWMHQMMKFCYSVFRQR